jgi:uncharacterized protein (DUF58 family)
MQVRSIPLGGVLIVWIGVTALIALNRGIDLLWGMTMLLLLATVIAALLPSLQVRGVHVRRMDFPASAVVGERSVIRYEVHAKGWLPRYGVEIHDNLAGEGSLAPTAFLTKVGRTRIHSFGWTPRQRGCWQLREVNIQSRYPLGLTRASQRIDAGAQQIIVYPDFVRLTSLPVSNDAHPRFEQMISQRRGGRDEFFGVRQYTAGDEPRSIHWRASARLDAIVVKEFEHQQDRQLWIVLDLAENQHAGRGATGTVESMIRVAHSIAVKACEDGIPVGLVYRVADSLRHVPAGADRATYHLIRDALARVNAHAQVPLARWLQRLQGQLPAGGTWVMFNLGGADQRASLARVATGRSATALFIEFDKASFAKGEPGVDARIRTQNTSHYAVSTVALGADVRQLFRI